MAALQYVAATTNTPIGVRWGACEFWRRLGTGSPSPKVMRADCRGSEEKQSGWRSLFARVYGSARPALARGLGKTREQVMKRLAHARARDRKNERQEKFLRRRQMPISTLGRSSLTGPCVPVRIAIVRVLKQYRHVFLCVPRSTRSLGTLGVPFACHLSQKPGKPCPSPCSGLGGATPIKKPGRSRAPSRRDRAAFRSAT